MGRSGAGAGAGANIELTVGSYVATRLIGRGGTGVVYEARRVDGPGRFALKVLDRQLAGDPVAARRFMREARALTRVSHPYVVAMLDSGVDGGRPFIVMEYLDGESLTARLGRERRLSVARLAELFLPAVSAIAALHKRKIVHRDLKPANLMVTRRRDALEELVVLDLGISRLDDRGPETAELTRTEALLGTLPYLSPEQLRNAKWAGTLSDQYTLGVVLYECATGARPFGGSSHYDLVQAIVGGPLEPPSARAPGISPAFDALVMRALSRDPGHRFPGLAALGSALLSCADAAGWARWGPEFLGVSARAPETTLASPPRAPKPSGPPPESYPRRAAAALAGARAGLRWAGAAAVLVAAALVGAWTLRARSTAAPSTNIGAAGDQTGDPENCGARGKSCEGGRCRAGRCQPVALISYTNAPGLFVPRQIAIDGRHLYLADYSDFNDSANTGEVYQVPLRGGPVTLLADGMEGPFGITSDGEHVYWTNYDGETVMRVPVGGGKRELLAEGQAHPNYITVDAENAYWTNFHTGNDRHVATATGSVMKWNKRSRRLETLARNQDFPNGLALDQNTVYWTNYANNDMHAGTIASVPRAGGAVTRLFDHEVHPFDLVVDGGNLYWTNLNSTLGGVKVAPLNGARAARVLTAASGGSPAVIAVQGDSLFWTERHTGRVVMQPKRGGPQVTLATDQVELFGIAADATRVFWVMRDGVMKLVR